MPSPTTSDNSEFYLLIKNMQVTRANAMPCPYQAGLPSMHGLVGMGRYLVHHALQGSGLLFDSIALCISAFHMSGSQQKYTCHSLKDIRKHQDIRIITARDSWFDASVLIRVSVQNGGSVDAVRTWLEKHKYLDELYSLRLCGGHVIYSGQEPNLTLLTTDEVEEVCKHLDGYFIADRIELCRPERRSEEDALDTLMRLIKNSKRVGHGWLVPLTVGFILLGQPERRKKYPPAYSARLFRAYIRLGLFIFSSCSFTQCLCE